MSTGPSSPVALADLPSALRGGVVAIGNFDGLHRGHQAVLAETRAAADRLGVPALMLTFEPHPRSVFRPDVPVFRLTPPEAKARIAAALGMDGTVVVPFDTVLAGRSAEDFVAGVLVGELGVRGVTVGYNFAYGHRRAGTTGTLEQAGAHHGFSVDVVEPFTDEGGERIDSTRIRTLLAEGDVAAAAGLLGYRWFFDGEVVHGDKRGRTIGYPTANMRLEPTTTPAEGVYAVVIEIGGRRHDGVASYGRRPMFDNGAPVFETFIFEYSGDLYGSRLRVTPVAYLRPEMSFSSVDELVMQMNRDSAEARALLAGLEPVSPLDGALLPLRHSDEQ